MRRAQQLELAFRRWGGKRHGAGRKPRGARAGVRHRARPEHFERHPVHITLRAERRLTSLRRQLVFTQMRGAICKTHRSWFRILHYSVQADHVHLLVEARDKVSLSRGISGASVRFARAINRVLGRSGAVWADRYHARALRTPREVRHGLVYVIMNFRKHVTGARGLDVCSSAAFFDGWRVPPACGPPRDGPFDDVPIRRPESWLARTGWKRHGLISPNEDPKTARRSSQIVGFADRGGVSPIGTF